MARRKQPSGRGFDLAFAAIQKQKEAAHQERCERAIALAEDLMFIAITGIKRHGDKITFEYNGHKFEVKEVED